MPLAHRITSPELEILRRSAAASRGLPHDQLTWLLGETARLLAERERMLQLIDDLRGPWPQLRKTLNDLNAILREADAG